MFVIEVGTVSKALRRVTHSKSMCEPQETASRRDRTVQGHNLDDSSTFADLGSSPSTLTAGGSPSGTSSPPFRGGVRVVAPGSPQRDDVEAGALARGRDRRSSPVPVLRHEFGSQASEFGSDRVGFEYLDGCAPARDRLGDREGHVC